MQGGVSGDGFKETVKIINDTSKQKEKIDEDVLKYTVSRHISHKTLDNVSNNDVDI